MKVRVRLFAVLREHAGRDAVEVELDDDATVADALDALAAQSGLVELLDRLPVRMAVNREYADLDTRLERGDELALITPVSGGADDPGEPGGDVRVQITSEQLSLEGLWRVVRRPSAGAIVTFQGTTRDVDRLEYEAYHEMAEKRIAAILRECVARHGLAAAAAGHRVGSVPLGEASVIVTVSATHRAEAFAGAREAIDRIKVEAPIWKQEVDREGLRRQWVEGTVPTADSAARAQEPDS